MRLSTKLILVSALIATKVIVSACDTGTSTSSGSSSSGSSSTTSSGSSGGTVLSFGGNSYSFTCPSPSNTTSTVTIPPTSSSSCQSTYQNYSKVFGCNLIDDFTSAQSAYESCLAQDVAACASASSSDPNC